MLELRRGEEDPAGAQVLKHFGVSADRALLHLFLGGLAAHARERSSLDEASLRVNELYERSVVFAADSRVVFTESRRDMNDAGTVCHCYIIVAVYEESLLVLLCSPSCGFLIQGLVRLVLQILALHGLKDFVSLVVGSRVILLFQGLKHLVQKSFRHVICAAVDSLNLGVCVLGVHAERDVGGQRPGSGRPCQEIGVLAYNLEAHDR